MGEKCEQKLTVGESAWHWLLRKKVLWGFNFWRATGWVGFCSGVLLALAFSTMLPAAFAIDPK